MAVTTHADLVRDQLQHLPRETQHLPGAGSPVRAGIAGSGNDLLVLTWSAADLARERAAGVRLLKRLGLREGARIANALPGALATPGSLLFGDVVQDLGGLDVPVGAVESENAAKQAWTLIDLIEPEVLVLNPASAKHLFAAAPTAPRPWWKGLLWLRTDSDDGVLPSIAGSVGFAGWQRVWLAVAEATSFLAVSCSASFFHIDDEATVEIVNADTGGPGTVVVTPRGFEQAPTRYLTRFRGRELVGSCRCGSAGSALYLDH